jgi:hypothetical protein
VDRTRLPFSLESAFHQIEVRVRNPNSSSHAVPGNTTSAKRRAVSFMNKSTQTTMSILARPRATWPASANDESMLPILTPVHIGETLHHLDGEVPPGVKPPCPAHRPTASGPAVRIRFAM